MSGNDSNDFLTSYFDELLGSEKEKSSDVSKEVERTHTDEKGPPVIGGHDPCDSSKQRESKPHSALGLGLIKERVLETNSDGLARKTLAAPEPKPAAPQPISQETLQVLHEDLVAKQRQKLQALLDKGLKVADPVRTKTVTEVKADPEVITTKKLDTVVETKQVAAVEAKAKTLTEAKLAQETSTDTQLEQSTGFSLGVNQLLEWHENGRPQWAQTRFDVLLFDVGGLTLAVPLVALGQIQPLGDDLTPLFGQSDWFMGLLNSPMGKIKTINTALFVMPEKYSDSFLTTAKYVISIDGLSWGLAVDSVNQPVSLEPDEVRWRGERSKRPWLAGTVKSAMCALIDIPQMAKLLTDADKSSKAR